ncbi:helix-turn-helix transcriptional regulator [Paraburkholderia strydomiana]|uniref:helix-turn-helix transcriptional regulator n=1 Tax=Paraburkholderia strydomiana TaxID=1245417 RepID=UPI0038B6E0BC
MGRSATNIEHPTGRQIMSVKPIFLDIQGVAEALALSESSVRTLINHGDFPKSRLLTGRRVAWLVRELEEWAEARPISNLPPVE